VAHYHLPCPTAVIASLVSTPRASIKLATWHHDLVKHRLFNDLMRPLTERFLDKLDSIIVTAPAQLDNTPILRRYKHKCRVIPLGIDERRFAGIDHDLVLETRAKYGSPLFLYVGRLVYYKGCEILIEAMRQVPNGNLVIVGDGPLRADLTALIRRENLENRVHLVGRLPEHALTALYQACDVFVLPSTLPTECFGLVQVEAMMCGKPVVNTSLATGVPWVSVHSETGLTVPPSDPAQLAGAMNALIHDHELRRNLGLNARKRAHEKFTLRGQVAATVAHYEELLAGKHSVLKSGRLTRTR
jgi:rhamnosyl/mannosyltransferase